MPRSSTHLKNAPRSRTVLRGKPIACQRCHNRKIKCSGERPCLNCWQSGDSTACVYPLRDRQIKVSEKYLDELVKENERLRSDNPTVSCCDPESNTEKYESVRLPLLEDKPWFHPTSSGELPVHVGEAADSAFATRLRQTLATGDTRHLPRMAYVGDDLLTTLSQGPVHWPSPARARFLIEAALSTVCQYYHIVRKSEVMKSLEQALKSKGNGEEAKVSKLLALFALGEVYSAKQAVEEIPFPGLAYFAQARAISGVAAERPQLDSIEISLLLVLYSFIINRRHSAYVFASSACRLGLIIGLNMNMPEHQDQDRFAREHRVRLWWAACSLDRLCASKLGLPVSMADDDIMVDMPNDDDLETAEDGDFAECGYILHSIKLSALAAHLSRAIYSRRHHHAPFLKRTQAVLKDLTNWMDLLPAYLHLKDGAATKIVYMHLRFNQCCILATRPVLLHMLRSHKQSWGDPSIDPKKHLPESALILVETCIQCARHTYQILTEAWIRGIFPTLDYFHTQYLYSATMALGISSLLDSSNSQQDSGYFRHAVELLHQLSRSGNYGAKEFVEHIDAIEHSIQGISKTSQRSTLLDADSMLPTPGPSMTTSMALSDPSLLCFLAEPDPDLQEPNELGLDDFQCQYWPETWADCWKFGTNM